MFPIWRQGFLCKRFKGRRQRRSGLFGGAEAPHGDGALFALAPAYHQKDRNLGEGMLPHFIIDLLVAKIALNAQPLLTRRGDRLRVRTVRLLRDRRHHDLHRRQPQRHMTGEMLDQNAR